MDENIKTNTEPNKSKINKSLKRNKENKTIEKNIHILNVETVEKDHIADPMFHKMSQSFDEGGAKGMLMNNLVIIIIIIIYLFIAYMCVYVLIFIREFLL